MNGQTQYQLNMLMLVIALAFTIELTLYFMS
jgi:hypothetical protein